VAVSRRESVTLRRSPVCAFRTRKSPQKGAFETPVCLRAGVRILVAFILVSGLAPSGLCAPKPPRNPQKTVEQEEGSVRRRFTISPNDVTLTVDQTQRFVVTEADGNPVPVRWKLSGVGCSGLDCGTIDDNGTYQTPQSLKQPLVVMLEGIPRSDSEYPAFARIQLAPPSAFVDSPAAPVADNAVAGNSKSGSTPALANSQPPQGSDSAGSAAASSTQAAPSQTPSVPAQPSLSVTYQGGQLAIDAQNETLASVLAMVARKTGATIDVPPGSGYERVSEHAGPGPVGDVLMRLLKGSSFNFVVVGSPQRPNKIERVLLSLRAAAPAGEASALASQPSDAGPKPAQAPTTSESMEEIKARVISQWAAQRKAPPPELQPEPQESLPPPQQ
jgi:hypothetical protein